MHRYCLSFVISFLCCQIAQGLTTSQSYEYTGHVRQVLRNTINAPIEINDPITVSFTFDPTTPNVSTDPDLFGSYFWFITDFSG